MLCCSVLSCRGHTGHTSQGKQWLRYGCRGLLRGERCAQRATVVVPAPRTTQDREGHYSDGTDKRAA